MQQCSFRAMFLDVSPLTIASTEKICSAMCPWGYPVRPDLPLQLLAKGGMIFYGNDGPMLPCSGAHSGRCSQTQARWQ